MPVVDEAIVTGTVDVGESSRVVRLLTPSAGRIAAIARGARTSKKRFAGLLDPGTRVRVETRRGRGELDAIATIDLVAAPRRAREDLDRLALLAYGCELCAALAPEHAAAPKLHGLLASWLDRLEAEDPVPGAARIALEAKALTFAGLTPALVRCARCGLPIEDPCVFDPESGGAVHARCGGGAPCRAEWLHAIERLRRTPLSDVAHEPLPRAARWLLGDFARHHLGRALHSRGLLEDLDAPG